MSLRFPKCKQQLLKPNTVTPDKPPPCRRSHGQEGRGAGDEVGSLEPGHIFIQEAPRQPLLLLPRPLQPSSQPFTLGEASELQPVQLAQQRLLPTLHPFWGLDAPRGRPSSSYCASAGYLTLEYVSLFLLSLLLLGQDVGSSGRHMPN